jgi:hypothetical protein
MDGKLKGATGVDHKNINSSLKGTKNRRFFLEKQADGKFTGGCWLITA